LRAHARRIAQKPTSVSIRRLLSMRTLELLRKLFIPGRVV
jgi:hypothetical protein